jgi:hypothetical protein
MVMQIGRQDFFRTRILGLALLVTTAAWGTLYVSRSKYSTLTVSPAIIGAKDSDVQYDAERTYSIGEYHEAIGLIFGLLYG